MARGTFLFALILGAPATTIAQTAAPKELTLAEAAKRRFPQPVRVGDLLQRSVLRPLESQPKLGRVVQIVRRPDGMIEVVVDYGGFLGLFARRIAVPVEGMALLGEYMEIVAFTPEELDHFPSFDPAGTTALQADTIIKVGLAKPSH